MVKFEIRLFLYQAWTFFFQDSKVLMRCHMSKHYCKVLYGAPIHIVLLVLPIDPIFFFFFSRWIGIGCNVSISENENDTIFNRVLRDFTPHFDSLLVRLSVCPSVRPLVLPSHFTFFFCGFWPHCPWLVNH